MSATLAYYKDTLGFDCVSTWDDPPVYAIVARDGHRIHFRLADPRNAECSGEMRAGSGCRRPRLPAAFFAQ